MKIRFASVSRRRFTTLFRADRANTLSGGHRNVSTQSFFRRKTSHVSIKQNGLFQRLSPVQEPMVPIVPILDQWANEGFPVSKHELQSIVVQLNRQKRYSHALQLSMWMSDKRNFMLASRDVSIRLELISRVHGIEKAEEYFNNIPKKLKDCNVYVVLFNCYARIKSMEKAEAILQTMNDLGFPRSLISYNTMLNLYHQNGNRGKFDALVQEMEQKQISLDKVTVTSLLTAYAWFSDVEGIEKTLVRLESDPTCVMDWSSYSIAAKGYLKAGLLDKALAMLKKSERLIVKETRGSAEAYKLLITQYAATGNKDEVIRVWEIYKKNEKIYNGGYISVIHSVLKFDDLEMAEKIYDQWESENLSFIWHIPNFLVGAYCKKSLLEKAEIFINKLISQGRVPDSRTWYHMAAGYLKINQPRKAVEATKKALLISKPWWKPSTETFVACLKYLKEEGDIEGAVEIIELLRNTDVVSVDVYDRLMSYTRGEKKESDSLYNLINGKEIV